MSKSKIRLFFITIIISLWVSNPIPFAFVSSEQSLNFQSIEEADIRLLKSEIAALKLSLNRNIFATTFDNDNGINSFESSIYDIEEVSSKKKILALVPINVQTKTKAGKNSIFVQN